MDETKQLELTPAVLASIQGGAASDSLSHAAHAKRTGSLTEQLHLVKPKPVHVHAVNGQGLGWSSW